MKTITIPKRFGYPTTEIISNGKHYTLKSGEEISVDDHLAEIIENAIALAPKYGMNKSKFVQFAEGSITEVTADDLDGIETIAYYAFGQCYSLKSIEFPNSLKHIKKSAFTACTSLESVRFGNNSRIESIEAAAFDWCSALLKVYLPETPPTLENVNAFSSAKAECVFYCKTQASLDAYKKAANWSTLTGTYSFVVE